MLSALTAIRPALLGAAPPQRLLLLLSRPFASAGEVGPAETAREQGHQAADTDYNATPQYPNKVDQDAGEAAMAASKAPHPSGAQDTSSMNDPAGRAEGGAGTDNTSDPRSLHVHHPGREADVAASNNSSGGSNNSNTASGSDHAVGSGGSGSFEGARDASDAGDISTGMGAANVVPGADRATTADFAAGGDDTNPPGFKEGAHAVNPTSGLPSMGSVDESGSGDARFGELKAPGEVGAEGITARQTEKSTGMDPSTAD